MFVLNPKAKAEVSMPEISSSPPIAHSPGLDSKAGPVYPREELAEVLGCTNTAFGLGPVLNCVCSLVRDRPLGWDGLKVCSSMILQESKNLPVGINLSSSIFWWHFVATSITVTSPRLLCKKKYVLVTLRLDYELLEGKNWVRITSVALPMWSTRPGA